MFWWMSVSSGRGPSPSASPVPSPDGKKQVLVTLIALMPMFRSLPIAALGAVVIVSAIQLIDIKAFKRLYAVRRSDLSLALLTFVGVLVFDVLPGIVFGVFVSLMEVLRRATFPNTAILGSIEQGQTYRDLGNYDEAQTEPGLVIYRFDAPYSSPTPPYSRTTCEGLWSTRNIPCGWSSSMRRASPTWT